MPPLASELNGHAAASLALPVGRRSRDFQRELRTVTWRVFVPRLCRSPPLGLSRWSADFALQGDRRRFRPPPPGLPRWSDDSSLRPDLRSRPPAYLFMPDGAGGH